jgi:hypothetical protein
MMNWEGFGRRQPWYILRYYPSILLEGLRNTAITSVRITGLRAEI